MVKRVIILGIAILFLGSFATYWVKDTTSAELVETVQIREQEGDFILHIRVENVDEGVKLLRSLEYIGTEPITIDHGTPLIAVSIDRNRQEFTGSPVNKTLEPGDIYLPEHPQTYSSLEKGGHVLFVHSQFEIDGQQINIKKEKDIVLK